MRTGAFKYGQTMVTRQQCKDLPITKRPRWPLSGSRHQRTSQPQHSGYDSLLPIDSDYFDTSLLEIEVPIDRLLEAQKAKCAVLFPKCSYSKKRTVYAIPFRSTLPSRLPI